MNQDSTWVAVVKKRRIWIGLAGGLLATGLWWLSINRAKIAALPSVDRGALPFVQMAGAGRGSTDQILREKAEFFDPTPLFFPTEWNYGQGPLRTELRQGLGQVFASFPPQFTMNDAAIKTYGVTTEAEQSRLPDLLRAGNQVPFGGLGHVDSQQSFRLAGRDGFLEVTALGKTDHAIAESLMGTQWPYQGFEPLEYIATIGPSGLVGDLLLVEGGGLDEVEAAVRQYLIKTYRLGNRLLPGCYRVVIGP